MGQTNSKETVKSCGCNMCRRGKRSKAVAVYMKHEERAARHSTKQALKKGELEDVMVLPAHRGDYTD